MDLKSEKQELPLAGLWYWLVVTCLKVFALVRGMWTSLSLHKRYLKASLLPHKVEVGNGNAGEVSLAKLTLCH